MRIHLFPALVVVGLLAGCVAHSPLRPLDSDGGDRGLIEALWQAGCDPGVYERTPRGTVRVICK
jgi:hypothetical protein